ncbi:hypothetical protein ER308_11235 [Egibacter rhizosphaerae]|uniref:Ornithine cyclodeaminase family protein n=2 Tax=Egibacter rhizosphaerae TaxID=1670831 RepID=A0A411YFU2_9ACTN|nr:hypothetical protein ER308_11235 [Egibacter rhizosphaerae]
MPACLPYRRAVGMKWVAYYPGNTHEGLVDSTGIVVLNDYETGHPKAILDGMWITFARTAACAAVFARYLTARRNPQSLALLGAGGLARWSLAMLSEEFTSLSEVRVTSRSRESRDSFCKELAPLGAWNLRSCETAEEAVKDAEIVVSAIVPHATPPFRAEWLAPGSLLIALDHLHAWDSRTFIEASRLIGDAEQFLVNAAPNYGLDWGSLGGYGDIGAIAAGAMAAREPDESRLVGIPTGKASIDIALAADLLTRNGASGRLAVDLGPRQVGH